MSRTRVSLALRTSPEPSRGAKSPPSISAHDADKEQPRWPSAGANSGDGATRIRDRTPSRSSTWPSGWPSASVSPNFEHPADADRSRTQSARPAHQAARRARVDFYRQPLGARRRTVTAAASAISCAPSAAISPIPSIWSPSRATRPELIRVLEWCDGQRIAVSPYGGGSSVTGGVEPPVARRLSRLRLDRSDPARQGPRS